MQPLIVQGDKTSHHGTVLEGSPFSDSNGKPIARVGDKVSCPKCMGIFTIAEGDKSNIVDGAPVAYQGCKVSCGAILIASQMATQTNPSSGTAPGAAAGDDAGETLARFGAIGAGMAGAYEDQAVDHDGRFKGRFQLVDIETGEPVKGEPVRYGPSGSDLAHGTTDDEGYTAWTEREATVALDFALIHKETS